MYKLFVIADIFKVQIETNCEKLENYIDEYMEDFRRLTIHCENCENCEDMYDMRFVYINSSEYNLELMSDDTICLKSPWECIDKSTVIPMVFRLIVEILRQRRHEIKMHASAVAKDGTAILFIAPSEGGKTSTAMKMCQKYGCELVANDAAVVSYVEEMPMVLRGDSLFKVRANGMQAYSPNDNSVMSNTNIPWYEKKIIETEELGIRKTDKALKLKYIFFVKLDALVENSSIIKYSSEDENDRWFKQRMMVLQNISGTLRGVDLIPTGNDGMVLPIFIPSVDTIQLSMFRTEFINALFSDCEVYQARGQLDEITKFIDDMAFGG